MKESIPKKWLTPIMIVNVDEYASYSCSRCVFISACETKYQGFSDLRLKCCANFKVDFCT